MIGKIPEELIESVFEALPVDITVLDADDKILAWSRENTRIFKIPEDITGRDIRKCHPPNVMGQLETILKEMKEGKQEKAVVWGTKDGKMVLTGYYALRNKDGKYLGCMEVDQDITEIQKLEGENKTID